MFNMTTIQMAATTAIIIIIMYSLSNTHRHTHTYAHRQIHTHKKQQLSNGISAKYFVKELCTVLHPFTHNTHKESVPGKDKKTATVIHRVVIQFSEDRILLGPTFFI